MKDLEKKLSKRKEINSNEEANAKDAENAAKGGKTGPEGVGNKTMSDLESRKSEVDNMRPKLNWKSLIRLMLSSSTVATNTTRTRPSRRGLTGLAAAAEMGAGAMPPGIKTDEDQHNKIALVLDTSGSMYQVIPTMLAECQKLLKTLGKAKFPITVIFFAGQAKWFQVNLSNNTYYKVNGPEDLNKPPPKDAIMKDYRVLLSKGGTGGTEFSGELVSQLVQLLGTGYNIMLFSDDNMFWPNNWPYLTQMYQSSQGRFFWICDNLRTWREACNKFGKIPKTFTHL